ncbi:MULTISPECIES: hypothetical protein [unclassified Paenibacillus]|uniref:DUF7010 family protein n=1 Tax=unclassified Paenibacillus TaxID=185978 RepID=UPI001B41E70D|nr:MULTISPECIES: hypothetical protein [unclassified Paenibacillus]MBP1154300.1 putative integral membrane protein [Paenibacillus sp. PvP091]MBP1170316.1 putative integral membrane protein [Paenibacillus sp. PvR098]MBP2441344.1 putative integral membrane protein [Paenibacillus sp. PvP052]
MERGIDMAHSLDALKKDLIRSSQRGYPILVSGAIFMLFLTIAPALFPKETVPLIWLIGMGSIFPLGLAIAKILGVTIITKDNPLGTLGGVMAGVQGFYIPVYIMIYQFSPEWIPFAVGLLGGSHFLVYVWIYNSKAYLFLTLGSTLASMVLGGMFLSQAYTLVPLALFVIYCVTVFWLLHENKKDGPGCSQTGA